MEYLIGAGLALGVAVFGALAGFERSRAFYPTVLVVVASYYQLFAVMGGGDALVHETIGLSAFAALAILGLRTNLWIVAVALAGHGVFDWLHPHVIENPGVPAWWPMFCGSYDVVAGIYLGWRIATGQVAATEKSPAETGAA